MSSLHVRSFMGSNVNNSSFAVVSVNTIRMKMHSWAVSLVSVDSSNCSEKHSQSAMSLQSCCIKSLAITSQRCVTVLLDSWRALIDDNISSMFLKSRNKESAASTKTSFIISPSWKDFLWVVIEWHTNNDALLVNSAVWKTTFVRSTVILVPSPFSFSAHFSGRSLCCTFYEQFESASQHSPSSEYSDGSLTNQTNAYFFISPLLLISMEATKQDS